MKGLKSGGKGSQSARKLSHPNSRPKIVDKVLAVSFSPDNMQVGYRTTIAVIGLYWCVVVGRVVVDITSPQGMDD